MATSNRNLEMFSNHLPDASSYGIGVVCAEWNAEVTDRLLAGALDALKAMGCSKVDLKRVPGTFELPLGAAYLADNKEIDAILTLGCVVQGETRHFDFICDAAANGVMQLSLTSRKPVIFGVLTTDNQQQALERAGGVHGNKGYEAAVTAVKMLETFRTNR
jgi:6,7-dimethyl-8-ribityllumazine synthase